VKPIQGIQTPLKNEMMKTFKYAILPVIFLMTSCYIYRPYSGEPVAETPAKSVNPASKKSLRGDDTPDPARSQKKENESNGLVKEMSKEEIIQQQQREEEKMKEAEMNKGKQEQNSFTSADGSEKNTKVTDKAAPREGVTKDPSELTVREKIKPKRFYKLTVLDKTYKVQVEKWEGDSLLVHKIRKPEKQFKFHENDIDNESVLERKFSKPFSDLLTVGAYAAGGAAVLLLIL